MFIKKGFARILCEFPWLWAIRSEWKYIKKLPKVSNFDEKSFGLLFNFPALSSGAEEVWLYCTKKNEYNALIEKVLRVDRKHFFASRERYIDYRQVILDTAQDYSIRYMVYVNYVNVEDSTEQIHIIREPRLR